MKRIFFIIALLFSTGLVAQEQGSIRGTILDQEMNNEPLLFANVQLKGADATEQSNLFGNFEINNIEPGNYILEISFSGYETKKISIEVKANEVTEIQETLGAITFDFDDVLTDEKAISSASHITSETMGGDKE